ncbi:hypothetical protein [Halorubrum sp. HHNYT27]|uniref:hypothetical protein n=1 Tax=Halorubrum sp. HHNYT27 TaxID=3402275 RepID=UPI003EBE3BED
MVNRHDVAICDDAGRIETLVTVTAMDGDKEQAEQVAALVAEQYQTTQDVVDEEVRNA